MFYYLLFFILSSCGITFIITHSSIFEPIREFVERRSNFFGELLSCPMCSGFWVGFLLSVVDFQEYNPIYAGAITSLISWFIATFTFYINSIALAMESSAEEEL